jgi:CBS domain-containing protein
MFSYRKIKEAPVMETTAASVMATRFHTLGPRQSIGEAVNVFKKAAQEEGRRVFAMMVIDDTGRLVGLLSMYDILLLLRPKHIHIWGEMEDIDLSGFIDEAVDRVRKVLVGDIMTTEVVSVSPDTHLMMVLDIMIKKHIRRLPVMEAQKILGVVYFSDVFYHFLERFIET